MKEEACRGEMGAVRRPLRPICPLEVFPVPTRAPSVERRGIHGIVGERASAFRRAPATDVIGFGVVVPRGGKRPRIITCHGRFHSGPAFWQVAAGEENGRNHNDCFPFSPSRFQIAGIVHDRMRSLVLWLKDTGGQKRVYCPLACV